MAVTARPALDAQKLRADFPIFEQQIHGKPLAYLDSAAQLAEAAPGARRDARRSTRPRTRTCTAASTSSPSARPRATRARARRCAAFVNAPAAREMIFTRNATEAINLVAYALGPRQPRPRRRRARHRARAPLELRALAVHRQADRRRVPDAPDRRQRASCGSTSSTSSPATGGVKVVATEPRLELARHGQPGRAARRRGRTSTARSWSSTPPRRRRTGRSTCRRSAATSSRFSAHKLCGPSGIGALWGRAELLERDGAVQARRPHDPQGHGSRRRPGASCPHKFEAGTPPIAEAVGFGAAIDYVDGGRAATRSSEHEHELAAYALERLAELPGVTTLRPARRPPRRDRLVQRRRHPPARRRAGARLRGRRDPRRAPLLPAADDDASASRRRTARASTSTRCRRRSTGSSTGCTRSGRSSADGEFDQLYREVILDHYKNPRGHGVIEDADARGRGAEPALRRRGLDLRRVRRGRRDDRRRQVLGPRLRDQPGGDLDADGDGQGPDRRARSPRCRRRSCSRRSASRSRRSASSARCSASASLKVALHKGEGARRCPRSGPGSTSSSSR